MAHGYGRGCRCEECREKHRETQLKYRQSVRKVRETSKVKELESRIRSHGVPEEVARNLAREIKAEFL